MAIELYWGSGSPFAWRVMLTLEVKKLAYESKLLEFSKGEHKTPAYLQLNPTRQSADPQRRRICRLRIDRDHGLPRSQISRSAALRQNARGNRFNLANDIGMRILSCRRRQQGCSAGLFRQGFGESRRDPTSGADDSPGIEIHRCASRSIELAGRRADLRGGHHRFPSGTIAVTRGIQRGSAAAPSRVDAVVANLSEPRAVGSANRSPARLRAYLSTALATINPIVDSVIAEIPCTIKRNCSSISSSSSSHC